MCTVYEYVCGAQSALALLLGLGAHTASALTVAQQKPLTKVDALQRFRGGGTLGTAIVSASAAIAGGTGVSMYLGTEHITKLLWLGLNNFPHNKYIAVAMIGWAVGKIAAVMEGEAATKHYASLNCIPLALWLATNFMNGAAPTTSIIPTILFGAYVYTGFIEA